MLKSHCAFPYTIREIAMVIVTNPSNDLTFLIEFGKLERIQ